MAYSAMFSDLMSSIAGRLRRQPAAAPRHGALDLAGLCSGIIEARAESTTLARADELLERYESFSPEERIGFFRLLRQSYGVDPEAALVAARAYSEAPDAGTLDALMRQAEPRRQSLFRRLNQAPDGTVRLVRMRADLLRALGASPDLQEVDLDLVHLFQSWFNGGFLQLRRIDWTTPAAILAKIVDYEAVHKIRDWDDLRGRIDPPDRRLYAFFHPQMPGEPLIFVEVALMREVPRAIGAIISGERTEVPQDEAKVAVFYSISNCQEGLRGISFGNLLIKKVVAELRAQLPNLDRFVTLSPVPGLRRWAEAQVEGEGPFVGPARTALEVTEREGWPAAVQPLEGELMRRLAARYLAELPARRSWPVDPVARFHIGNGARLHDVHFPGDPSASGRRSSLGVMVNYDYRLQEIEANSEAFFERDQVSASPGVVSLMNAMQQTQGERLAH